MSQDSLRALVGVVTQDTSLLLYDLESLLLTAHSAAVGKQHDDAPANADDDTFPSILFHLKALQSVPEKLILGVL